MSTRWNSLRNLRALLGNDVVADDTETLAAHGGDKWIATHPPDVVVFARSTEQVSRLLRFASARKIPVTARGAGYGYVGSCVPVRGGIALSLMRMNRIKEINFADAVAVVEPGVIHRRAQSGRARAETVLSAGPREHEGLHHRRKRRDECRRAALFEIRRDAQLCDRS